MVRQVVTPDYKGNHRPLTPDGELDPIHALGNTVPPDVYEHPEWYGWGEFIAMAAHVIRSVRGNPEARVILYRAAPEGVDTLNPGEWVATVEAYARQHAMQNDNPADDWPVYAVNVRAGDVYTGSGDIIEWGYWGPALHLTRLPDPPRET